MLIGIKQGPRKKAVNSAQDVSNISPKRILGIADQGSIARHVLGNGREITIKRTLNAGGLRGEKPAEGLSLEPLQVIVAVGSHFANAVMKLTLSS
jgi:hypothetical protein